MPVILILILMMLWGTQSKIEALFMGKTSFGICNFCAMPMPAACILQFGNQQSAGLAVLISMIFFSIEVLHVHSSDWTISKSHYLSLVDFLCVVVV